MVSMFNQLVKAMETMIKTDVLIVGAGPTGLSVAIQLMRYDVNFIIVDQNEGVTELSKALVVHARTLEIYDQFGLAQPAIAEGERVQKAVFMNRGKVSLQLNLSDLGGQLSPFPFLLMLEQSKTERLLYEHLQHHGKNVQWQTELKHLTQDTDGVRAVCKTANGETQTIEARYLVGCDGAGSPTRHLLDIPFEGSTNPRLFYVADVEMDIEMEVQTNMSALYGSYGWDAFVLLFPMQGEKRWRLIGNVPEYNDQVGQEVSFDEIETKVKRWVQRPLEITAVHWFSTYKVHTRRAKTFSSGRCFLAGDAAHTHTPAGGQGMNTGIQDAYNLAWKIAWVLKGYAGDSLLESYHEERSAVAKRLLQTTDRVFDVQAGTQWYFRFLRDKIFPTLAGFVMKFSMAKDFLFPLVSQIGLNYRQSFLSQSQPDKKFKVKAGDRMPYFLVDGVNMYDKLRHPKFHLVIFSNEEHDYEDLELELGKEYNDLIDLNVIPLDPRVVEIFGTNQPFKVLLRPDNYIGLLSIDLFLNDLKSYFNRLMASAS